MGDFIVSCMASGLPIPKNSEAVVLFVTPSYDIESGGCHCHSLYKFISFPMFITMDDYGGYGDYFGEYNFQKGELPWHSKLDDLKKQTSWKIFWNSLKSVRKDDNSDIRENSDWARGIHFKESGIWHRPGINQNFNDGIRPTAITYYRKDVWDWMIENGKETCEKDMSHFENELRDICAPIDPSKEIDTQYFSRSCRNIVYGDFLGTDIQSVLRNGGIKEKWDKKVEIDLELSPEEHNEIINHAVNMYRFSRSLENVCRPILPHITTAPQGGWYIDSFRKDQENFHKLCLGLIEKDLKEIS